MMTMTTEVPFRSHQDLIHYRELLFEDAIRQGEFTPLLLHQAVIPLLLLLIPLLIPHWGSHAVSKLVRYLSFVLIACLAIYGCSTRRALGIVHGYVIGLAAAWLIVWSATLLIFNDVDWSFKRIERKVVPLHHPQETHGPLVEGSSSSGATKTDYLNGPAARLGRDGHHPQHSTSAGGSVLQGSTQQVLRWQSYPISFFHRLDWVLDLVFNFRGSGWNWRITSQPALPKEVVHQLEGNMPSSSKDSTTEDAWRRFRSSLLEWVVTFLTLDVIKVLMNRDPYFWGFTNPAPSPLFPFSYLEFSPLLVRTYRTLLAGCGVIVALQNLMCYNPIVCLGFALLFPRQARALTDKPLDAVWLYPEHFGPFTELLDNGLEGGWGQWWHQLFRFGFSETARWLISCLPAELRKSVTTRRLVRILVVFGVSGLIHASGSYTAFPPTQPLHQFLFFFFQAMAFIALRSWSESIGHRQLPVQQSQRWRRRTMNFVAVSLWLFLTAPFIVDDWSKGGLWLYEPIPISPLRGLGFGVEGEGWWCWRPWFRWRNGGSWWETGWQVL